MTTTLLDNRPYAIIGNGRMARHMAHYFNLLGIRYHQWSRTSDLDLAAVIAASDRILLLITDSAINAFYQEHSILSQKVVVHFSGALVIEQIPSAHPLISVAEDLYDLDFYQKIPFITETENQSLNKLLPELPNPNFSISRHLKALYHSLCVLSGNFTTLLWQKFFKELEQTFGLPKEIAQPYMQSIFNNLQSNPTTALTGPLARNDQSTLQKNLAALGTDPFTKVYSAFVHAYQEMKNGNP